MSAWPLRTNWPNKSLVGGSASWKKSYPWPPTKPDITPAEADLLDIGDFQRAELRVAQVLSAERVDLNVWRRRPLLQRFLERMSYWLLARVDVFLSRTELMRKMR